MEDSQIIELYWTRSEDAIQYTRERYESLCYALASRILSDRRDAEECVSEAYLRIWNAIPPERPARLGAFLAKIVRNLALDRYDYLRAARRNAELELAFDELGECLPDGADVEQAADGKEVAQAVSRFLRTQPQKVRKLFIRHYWYGDSLEVLAKAFGMSQSAVKSQLFRTRSKLREALREEEIFL